MKLKASALCAGGGGGNEFRQGLRVENSTTNRLLSLMILMKLKSFSASRGRGEPEFRRGFIVENCTTNRPFFSNGLMNRKSFRALRGSGGGGNLNSDEDLESRSVRRIVFFL